MESKTKKKAFKILLSVAAMLLVIGSTVGVTLALTRNNYKAGFSGTIVGARDVEATISGASYLDDELIERVQEVTFTGESTESTESITFDSVLVENEGSVLYYEFEIRNNSEKDTYSDLIIQPTCLVEQTGISVDMEYKLAVNDDYEAVEDRFLVVHKQETIYVRFGLTSQTTEDVEFSGNVVLDLYTEKDKPTNFDYEYVYSIGEDGKGYKAKVCPTCNAVGEPVKMNANEYVIVNPDTAQEVLDSDINGKVIIFGEGNYNKVLHFRPTYETATVYETTDATNFATETEVDVDAMSADKVYHYVREFNDVVIAGTEKAVFSELFAFESMQGTNVAVDGQYILPENQYDAVRKVDLGNEGVEYYSSVIVNNTTFTGLKFTGARGRIYAINFYSEIAGFNNVTITDCTFETDTYGTDGTNESHSMINSAIYLGAFYTGAKNTNIVVQNNIIDGHRMGIYVINGENVTIENNEISNTIHNAIAIQSYAWAEKNYLYYFTGDIVIKDNTITNVNADSATGERAIRFNFAEDATILVEGNTFVNCDEDRGAEGRQILATNNLINSTYSFINNTYAEDELSETVKLDDIKNVTTDENGANWVVKLA